MKRGQLTILFASVFVLMLASTNSAMAEGKAFRLRVMGDYTSDADVGDGDGSVALTAERLTLDWKFLSLSYTQTQFHWDDVSSLSFGNGVDDPWERLHRLRLGSDFRGDINDQWFYHTGLALTSSFEKEMDDSYGGVVRGGVGYKWSDEITIMGGLAVSTNSLKTRFMPNIAVAFDGVNDNGVGWKGRVGLPSIEMGYHFNRESALRWSLGNDGQTARLANDSAVAQKGYVSMAGWQTGLYYDWKPTDSLSLSIGPEYVFGRSMTIYNETADKMFDEDVDSAWGGTLRFRWAF